MSFWRQRKSWAVFLQGENVEISSYDGLECKIEYTGKLSGSETFVARRGLEYEGFWLLDVNVPFRILQVIDVPELERNLEEEILHYYQLGIDPDDQQFVSFAQNKYLALYRISLVEQYISSIPQHFSGVRGIVPFMSMMDSILQDKYKNQFGLSVRIEDKLLFGFWMDGTLVESVKVSNVNLINIENFRYIYVPNKWKNMDNFEWIDLEYGQNIDIYIKKEYQGISWSGILAIVHFNIPLVFSVGINKNFNKLDHQYNLLKKILLQLKYSIYLLISVIIIILTFYIGIHYYQLSEREQFEKSVAEQRNIENAQVYFTSERHALLNILKQKSRYSEKLYLIIKDLPPGVVILRWYIDGNIQKIEGYSSDEREVSSALKRLEKSTPGIKLVSSEKLSHKSSQLKLGLDKSVVLFKWEIEK